MRFKGSRILPVALLIGAALVLAGCSGKQVSRVDVEEQIDLSGEWNDVDSQKVSAALVTQITASPWVEDFMAEQGKKPYLIIGTIRNKTPEHIAVKTFIGDLERSFINGASEETMKQWGREKGADYMLIGEINSMFDQEGGDQVKYYQVDCYLVDLEDNVKVWAGFEKIKKFVGRGKYKG